MVAQDRWGHTLTFTDDANGNRTNSGYATGTGNRLENDGTWTYTYDAEGNLTKRSKGAQDETWTFGYDHRNQLIWVEQRSTDGGTLLLRAEYDYDVFGNRIEKRIDSDGDSSVDVTQRYAYDGWNPARGTPVGNENWDVWADFDGSNTLETRYVRGDAVDELFARIDASDDTYWVLTDRLGSVRNVVDESGVIQGTVAYDGFGNITSESGASAVGRYKWTGREFDVETELQHNRGRNYAAPIARWTSEDPKGFEAGDTNLYRYVGNSPQMALDPSGHIIIYVHGIRDDSFSWALSLHDGINAAWADNPTSKPAQDRFVLNWKGPVKPIDIFKDLLPTIADRQRPKQSPTLTDAKNSLEQTLNDTETKRAVEDLISAVKQIRDNFPKDCKEPINIVAHSQGTLVTLAALDQGMKVDNVILLNSPLHIDTEKAKLSRAVKNADKVVHFWSKDDTVVPLINRRPKIVLPPIKDDEFLADLRRRRPKILFLREANVPLKNVEGLIEQYEIKGNHSGGTLATNAASYAQHLEAAVEPFKVRFRAPYVGEPGNADKPNVVYGPLP
jgi:RHS repeat-associated protein